MVQRTTNELDNFGNKLKSLFRNNNTIAIIESDSEEIKTAL